MSAPRNPADLRRDSAQPSSDEELMDVVGLMLGMTMLNIVAVNASAEARIRAFLEEAMEQDFARDHALAIRSIASALDRQSISALFDLIDAGDLSSVTDLVGASRAVN